MRKLCTIMRHLSYLLLSMVVSLGFAEPHGLLHLDKSILKHYQSTTSTKTIQQHQSIDEEVNQLYQHLPQQSGSTTVSRLNYFSQYYLNSPYILFPLGEGHPSQYDEMPRARLDGFDCQTYVDTVLALTLANNLNHFKKCLDKVRYHNGSVSFVTRNHFTSLDWNKNNQANGYLEDITHTMTDQKKHPIVQYASTEIDKASWYQKLPLARIRVSSLTAEKQIKRLKTLHIAGKKFKPEHAIVPYIPLNQLIDKKGQPRLYFLKQIPSGAIIEIVRPHWQLKNIIGTDLDISHLGFAFWKNNVLYFRQASSNAHKVIDIPLVTYLNEASKNPTIGGINIQIIQAKTPLQSC